MKAKAKILALLAVLVVACGGGTTMPADDAGTTADADAMTDSADAADGQPDAGAGCMRCLPGGYIDTCTNVVAHADVTCWRCDLRCTPAAECGCIEGTWWCAGKPNGRCGDASTSD